MTDLAQHDREREAARAKVVREALLALSKDLHAAGEWDAASDAVSLAYADDHWLAKLGRMLR